MHELIEKYIYYLKNVQNQKPKTIEKTEAHLMKLETALGKPLIEAEKGSEIETVCVQVAGDRLIRFNKGTKDNGECMKHRLGCNASQFMTWAFTEGYMIKNVYPRNTFKRPPEVEAAFLHNELIDALINNDRLEVREQAIVRFLLDTGLRRSELCSIKKSDIDMIKNEVHVREGKGYTSRTIPFSDQTKFWIETSLSWRKKNSEYLFPNAKCGRMSSAMLGQIMQDVSKVVGFRVTCHMIRHSVALLWLRAKKDLFTVSRMLGHTSLHMTLKYFHILSEELRQHQKDVYEVNHDLFIALPKIKLKDVDKELVSC
jgi:site-specific recombinase XerD